MRCWRGEFGRVLLANNLNLVCVILQHYVPLDDFATNVEERMQWILDNDAEAEKISKRATLWMEDLVFHPDAAEDDRLIQEEILGRYQAHFIGM